MDKDKSSKKNRDVHGNKKDEQLEKFRRKNTGPGKKMTDDHGVKVSNDRTTLRAGRRGPSLFVFRK